MRLDVNLRAPALIGCDSGARNWSFFLFIRERGEARANGAWVLLGEINTGCVCLLRGRGSFFWNSDFLQNLLPGAMIVCGRNTNEFGNE